MGRRRPRPAEPVTYPPPSPEGGGPPVPRSDDGPDATLDSVGTESDGGNAIIGRLRRAWGLPTVLPKENQFPSPKLVEEFSDDVNGTANHRGYVRLGNYAKAMAEGTPQHQAAARALLIDFYVKQRTTQGHWWREELSTSHGHHHLNIGVVAHALALHYGDEALLAETGYFWRVEATIGDVTIDADGHRTHPGGRAAKPTKLAPVGSSNGLLTVCSHLLRGTEWPENSLTFNRRGEVRPLVGDDFWNDPYNFAAWGIRELKRRRDTLGGATEGRREKPLLHDELRIERDAAGNSRKWFLEMHSSEARFWSALIEGQRSESPIRGGRFPAGITNPFLDTMPELPGATTLTVVRGVRS